MFRFLRFVAFVSVAKIGVSQTSVQCYFRGMKKDRRKAPPPPDPDKEPYLIGYARVSTLDQNPQLQIDALKAAGVPEDRIYQEQVSSAAEKRPQFDLMMRDAREGDIVCVWKLDRLGRNVSQVLATFAELQAKGAAVRVITQPGMDTSTPMGRLFVTIMAAFAELERDLIRERTIAGLAVARAAGRIGGRQSKLSDEKVLAMAHLTPAQAVKRTGLTRTGWLRRLAKAQERAAQKAKQEAENGTPED